MSVADARLGRHAHAIADAEVCSLIFDEARLLDGRHFEDWLALYTPDGFIWAPAQHDAQFEDRLSDVSLFFDDRELMEQRVRRLRHPRIHSQLPPSRTSRVVSNVVVAGEVEISGDTRVLSRFVLVETRGTLHRVFGGSYEHWLRRTENEWRIAGKIARVTNCDAALTNLAVPF